MSRFFTGLFVVLTIFLMSCGGTIHKVSDSSDTDKTTGDSDDVVDDDSLTDDMATDSDVISDEVAGDEDVATIPVGEKGGECYPNDTCNDDLICEKGICVTYTPSCGNGAKDSGET